MQRNFYSSIKLLLLQMLFLSQLVIRSTFGYQFWMRSYKKMSSPNVNARFGQWNPKSAVPCSTMRPFFNTTMWSAFCIVDNRWAITMHVRPWRAFSNASWTIYKFRWGFGSFYNFDVAYIHGPSADLSALIPDVLTYQWLLITDQLHWLCAKHKYCWFHSMLSIALPSCTGRTPHHMYCTFSLSVSKADVASSNNKIFGFLTKALAMAILCFWPPDNCTPFSPALVL